jgi:hypothetical protein
MLSFMGPPANHYSAHSRMTFKYPSVIASLAASGEALSNAA